MIEYAVIASVTWRVCGFRSLEGREYAGEQLLIHWMCSNKVPIRDVGRLVEIDM